ncbi:MAG: hypothetical protein K0S43_1137 [Cellulosimicrobium sp.]|jgi:hypothetical protein|nr:hypothetical protein [Cellulosimicrobium sp.]
MSTTTSIGDQIEALTVDDLSRADSLQRVAAATGGAPSNQQILDAMKSFYSAHTAVVDGTARNTGSVAQNHPDFVSTMNGYDWKDQQLGAGQQSTTGGAIFGGIFDPELDDVNADHLFSTIGVGVSADLQFFVGGAGGLGCMWDIAKREGPRGYGYATGEVGIRIAAELNVQCFVTNQLPSQTDLDVFGLKVSVDLAVSLSFQTFWYGNDLHLLGFAIGAGVGLGGGATVFGGHIWNFG